MSLFNHDKDYAGPTDRAALEALRVLDDWATARDLTLAQAHPALIEVFGAKAPQPREVSRPRSPRKKRGKPSEAVQSALALLSERSPRTIRELLGPGMLDKACALKHLAAAGCHFQLIKECPLYLVHAPKRSPQ